MTTVARNFENICCIVAGDEHVIDPRIEFQYSNAKGEGYLGVVKSVKVVGKNKDLNLIVKFASPNQILRDQAPIREAFIAEIWFYEQIIPALIKFQLDQGLKNPFVNFAKCYFTQTDNLEEVLLLEDLKDLGFVCWDRQKPMDHRHLKFVFKEYGRFHAISFAMKEHEPETYSRLASKMLDVIELFHYRTDMGKAIAQMVQNLKNIFNSETERDLYQSYSSFADIACQDFGNCCINDDVSIILHGDCWSNNMLFKYEDADENKEPLVMNLIDFQLSKEGPPVIDLAYFFYVCAADESLNKLNEYLSIYHTSLKDTLSIFDLNVEEVYPFERLMEQWKKYGRFGLLMAFLLIKLMLSDSDEAPDISEMSDSDSSFFGAFMFEGREANEYRRRMRALFEHFHENKFL